MSTSTRLLTIAASLLVCAQALAFSGYVEIRNRTGYDIYVLQVSHERSGSWEEDVLGDDILRDGAAVRLGLQGYSSPMFDVRATDEDGDTYTFMGVNIARENVVIGNDDIDTGSGGIDGDIDGYVDITNRTGYSIMYLYVSHEDSSGWEADVLDEDILPHGQTVRVDLAGFESSAFDIRAVDEDGDSYTRWAVDIVSEDVTLTGRDLD